MALRNITGNLIDLVGAPLPNTSFSLVPNDFVFGTTLGTTVFGDVVSVTSDEEGDVDFNLYEGVYTGRISTRVGPKVFTLTVDPVGPWTLGRLIGPLQPSSISPVITDVLQAAEDAAQSAQDAAQAAQDAADAVASITLPLPIASGGTGVAADTVEDVRVALGASAVGDALFTAADEAAARTALGAAAAEGAVPAGSVIWYAANTPPAGYLKANGALVSRSTYAALFAVIGETFGAGDGSTTFALPDLRGEFIRGWDDGRGEDTGRVFGSAQSDAVGPIEVAQDTFSSTSSATGMGQPLGRSGLLSFTSGSFVYGRAAPATPSDDVARGVQNAAETRPRNIALLACIKF